MRAPVSVGIIGCGVIAPEHIRDFQLIEGVTVAWACDLDIIRARVKAAEFSIAKVTADYRDILNDPAVQAVSVCTDHASHSSITVNALDAGKDVLCEKPLASTVEGLDAMVAAHIRNPKRVFGAVFQHRFDAANRYLKELIDEGVFGTLLTCSAQLCCLRTDDYYRSASWRGTWAGEGGGALINQNIHFVDILAWLIGGIDEIRGCWTNRTHDGVMETEDTAVAAVRFRCGALGTITATVSSHIGWEPLISIRGSRGSVDLAGGEPSRIAFSDPVTEKRVREGFAQARNIRADTPLKVYYGPSHAALVADFVAAVRERRAPAVSGESARHAVDIVLSIYTSQQTGAAVCVPPPQYGHP